MRLFGSVKGKSVFNLFAKTNGEQLPKEEFTVEKTNDNLTQPAQDRFKLLREYAVITAGLFLAALAIYFFMMPSNIIFGSITGLAMVLVHFIPVSVSVMDSTKLVTLAPRMLASIRSARASTSA